ncbi:MAG TPA: P-loop NTPase [Labilithrix sp.]|nr:P-loop NTPase [Labilithrix sp.]
MTDRSIRLHVFCSVKGGVGKSTLATVCAKLLRGIGRVPLLIDCDLMGTSLADGLELRAPDATQKADGSLDLDAPPTGRFLSVNETRARRAERRTAMQTEERWRNHPHPPPFVNDILNHAFGYEKAARVDALIWRHQRDDGVLYLPSSSTYDDVIESAAWFYGEEFDWARALLRTLGALPSQIPTLTDVVLDLPPGVWGFPHEILDLVSMLLDPAKSLPEDYPPMGGVRWEPNPFLVTSCDPNDLVPALEYIARHQDVVPNLKPVVNRRVQAPNAVRALARSRLGSILSIAGIEETIAFVDHVPTLAKVFWEGDLDMVDVPHDLIETLRLGG